MKMWVVYAIAAGAAYGLSAVQLKLAAGRDGVAAGTLMLSSCLGALLGAAGYLLLNGRGISFPAGSGNAVIWAGISGIIGAGGGIAVIKALEHKGATASGVMSLVNTSVLFALVFGIILLKEIPANGQVARSILGAVLACLGSALLCL